MFAIVPSPLLPESGWEGVADALRGDGRPAVVLDSHIPASADPADLVARLASSRDGADSVARILLAHSGAGMLVPALVARTGADAAVFIDAALPPAMGRVPMAPEELAHELAPRASIAGDLPPWTRWWSDDETDGLYPDDRIRDELDRTAPTIPLAWLRARIDVAAGWDARPAAYLAFGDTYAAEAERAESLGWPVARLAGGHLHHLHDPGEVAETIQRLSDQALGRIRSRGGPGS